MQLSAYRLTVLFLSSLVRPEKKELLQFLTQIKSKWPEIGMALDVSSDDRESIRRVPQSDVICLDAVLQIWMDRDESVTWQVVIEALEGSIVGNPRIAKEIKESLGIVPGT